MVERVLDCVTLENRTLRALCLRQLGVYPDKALDHSPTPRSPPESSHRTPSGGLWDIAIGVGGNKAYGKARWHLHKFPVNRRESASTPCKAADRTWMDLSALPMVSMLRARTG